MTITFTNAAIGDCYDIISTIEGLGISTAQSFTITSGCAFSNYAGLINPFVLNDGTSKSISWVQVKVFTKPAVLRSTKSRTSAIPAGTVATMRIYQVARNASL